jgi:hypothetical protein
VAERAGQGGGGKAGFCNQQAARRFPIQPVHQPRLLSLGVTHHFQHVVDVSRDAGAALHRKPRRLVQHHDVGVLEDGHLLQRLQCLGRSFGQRARALRGVELERRNADALAFFQPVLAVGALAVDAQFALPDDALDVGERKAGKTRLEETVDTHVVLVGGDDDGLDFCRQRRRLGDDLLGRCGERRRPLLARLGKARGLGAGAVALRPVAGLLAKGRGPLGTVA